MDPLGVDIQIRVMMTTLLARRPFPNRQPSNLLMSTICDNLLGGRNKSPMSMLHKRQMLRGSHRGCLTLHRGILTPLTQYALTASLHPYTYTTNTLTTYPHINSKWHPRIRLAQHAAEPNPAKNIATITAP